MYRHANNLMIRAKALQDGSADDSKFQQMSINNIQSNSRRRFSACSSNSSISSGGNGPGSTSVNSSLSAFLTNQPNISKSPTSLTCCRSQPNSLSLPSQNGSKSSSTNSSPCASPMQSPNRRASISMAFKSLDSALTNYSTSSCNSRIPQLQRPNSAKCPVLPSSPDSIEPMSGSESLPSSRRCSMSSVKSVVNKSAGLLRSNANNTSRRKDSTVSLPGSSSLKIKTTVARTHTESSKSSCSMSNNKFSPSKKILFSPKRELAFKNTQSPLKSSLPSSTGTSKSDNSQIKKSTPPKIVSSPSAFLIATTSSTVITSFTTTESCSRSSKRYTELPGQTFSVHEQRLQQLAACEPVLYRQQVRPQTFHARDNVSNFISFCRHALRIRDCLLFETDDLVMRKNERSFVLCLLEVARFGIGLGMATPLLVQMEQEIDREIAQDAKDTDSAISSDCEPEESMEPRAQIVTNDLKSLHERVS